MKSEELPKERTNGNKPAYPVHGGNGDDTRNHTLGGGLTKREEFAKAAMQGLLSNAVFMDNVVYDNDQEDARKKIVARTAIITADELLKQLEHGGK